ncbi:hypothetical protein HMPREF0454_00128 [Hafnia alvei ATCC 51873]|uniref:Uncharacterized protein n=1 Tax=Hafnia alvei ATCC 51873 TaxID=1002364 RepID=G9Y0S0_HAFAL|nr:hypothetical protein F652_2650 [Enterobacteriaceae bacterium bta3-1]EHM48516.1 hypothetical protein HMPREF0454_00128 [Hafnia alvei ATCC 51873]
MVLHDYAGDCFLFSASVLGQKHTVLELLLLMILSSHRNFLITAHFFWQ